MSELFESLFSIVCGQDASRSWSTSQETMPLCARCSGIYAGAFVTLAAWPLIAPRPRLWLTALAIVAIVQILPAGLGLFGDSALGRTASGYAFGCGLAFVLWQRPSSRWTKRRGGALVFAVVTVGAGGLLLWSLTLDSAVVLRALEWIDVLGLAGLVALTVAQIFVREKASSELSGRA